MLRDSLQLDEYRPSRSELQSRKAMNPIRNGLVGVCGIR
jgi:hypothetical protein